MEQSALNLIYKMSFYDCVIEPLQLSMTCHGERNAFFIQEQYSTYNELTAAVTRIRKTLHEVPEQYIALAAHDNLLTYASILAIWMEGKCYIPLHPLQPKQRCENIICQMGIETIIDSEDGAQYGNRRVICPQNLPIESEPMKPVTMCADDMPAYILFTSGSTGRPKGVPVTRHNLAAFVESVRRTGFILNENDRCLQMFDLTFDLSVQSFLLPALAGACAYTVSPKKIKYQAVFELLDEQKLTFTMMVPSVIHYLRPYMNELNLPELRLSLFAGEGLPADDLKAWSECATKAEIHNVYGPTENTIYCTDYCYRREGKNKQANGIISIGRVMPGTEAVIVDENLVPLPTGRKGELCLAGEQLTPGYWHDEQKNNTSFFNLDGKRFYRTGDICDIDLDGDINYYGRTDSQIKIQGFRIELSEIECVARRFFVDNTAVVAIAMEHPLHGLKIHLVVERTDDDNLRVALSEHLKQFLPTYMLPAEMNFIPVFPMNTSGKIDKQRISNIIKNI